MSVEVEFQNYEEAKFVQIQNLDKFLENTKTREHYVGIFFTPSVVIKTKNRFTPQETNQQYKYLAASSIPIGTPPRFVKDESGRWAEINDRIHGPNGADFLMSATNAEALDFFVNVILNAATQVLSQGENLTWSIDNLPHNYVKDSESGLFKYVDYEPSHKSKNHSHFLIPEKFINYTLVKFARERPELFSSVFNITIGQFKGKVEKHLLSRPYAKYLNNPKISLIKLLQETDNKDDQLGLLLAWISTISGAEIVQIAELLKHTDNMMNSIRTQRDLISFLAYGIGKNNPDRLREILFNIWK